jgi:hypothetical protein
MRQSRGKPDRGVAKLLFRVLNQEGTLVQEGRNSLLMRRRPA